MHTTGKYALTREYYVHTYILATAWYSAQILPLPANCVRQINTVITWYLWRGDIFRVPLSTLQLPKQKGGWGLLNIDAKCKALYFHRLRAISQGGSEFTALWLRKWDLTKQEGNPPHIHRIPSHLEYLRISALDSAYISSRDPSESEVAYKRRIYSTM